MGEACPDTYDVGYIHQFHPQPTAANSLKAELKDILPCNISQIITKTIPISMRIVIIYAMEQSIQFWVCQKVNGNWDSNMIKISQRRESHSRTNKCQKKIQKSRTVRVTARDPSRKVNHLGKVIWDYNRIHQFYQFHQNRLASPYKRR